MDNPIKYNDLFDPDVEAGINKIVTSLTNVQNSLGAMVADAKKAGASLKSALEQTAKANGNETATVEKVYEAYKKMNVELDGVAEHLQKLKGSSEDVALTQKEMNRIVKLGNEYNSQRSDAYGQLSKQYSAMKIVINQLTQEERENTEEGKRMVEQARQIYQQMNMLQQQTGKYQLQVGNYSKAMNGLNIATQQVIREMPVLANGLSMFVMAISNNIPILLDNIKAVKLMNAEAKKTGGEIISVGKAIAKSIFSWQTALIVLLTVLPTIIRKIKEKKKAQDELNVSTKNQISYLSLLNEALLEVARAEVEEAAKAETMITIMDDETRSANDRVGAGKVLKQIFKDELSAYSAEEIAAGKAKEKIDDLTNSIKEQAKARALMAKITELSSKQVEYTLTQERLKGKTGESKTQTGTIEDLYQDYLLYGEYETVYTPGFQGSQTSQRIARYTEQTIADIKEYADAVSKSAEIEKVIDELVDMLNPFALLEDKKGAGGGRRTSVKEAVNKDLDYIRRAIRAGINLINDDMEREIAQSNFSYSTQIEDLKSFLDEQKELRRKGLSDQLQITETGEHAITDLISHLREEQINKERDIRDKYTTPFEGGSAGKEKGGKAESPEDLFKKRLAALKMELDTRDNLAVKDNRNHLRRKREKLDNEKWFLAEYKKLLIEFERLTPREKANITAKTESAEAERVETLPNTFLGLIGFAADEEYNKKFERGIERMYDTAMKYMTQWMDARKAMAEEAVKLAQKESDAAKSALDLEQQARVNGYAHNVGLARKEYEEKEKARLEALKEEQRIAAIQQRLDDAQQMSSLLVATANMWAAYTKGNIFGAVLAGLATTAMWGSFAAAKVQAANLVKTKTYGEGMSEYLDYGGSHASGNDIDFGTMKDGTRRRVERGEMVAVINKRNVNRYGVGEVSNIIDSLNSGTFQDRYGSAFAGIGLNQSAADLSKVEDGISQLVSQGEKKIVVAGNTTIEYYKHRKRIIRN